MLEHRSIGRRVALGRKVSNTYRRMLFAVARAISWKGTHSVLEGVPDRGIINHHHRVYRIFRCPQSSRHADPQSPQSILQHRSTELYIRLRGLNVACGFSPGSPKLNPKPNTSSRGPFGIAADLRPWVPASHRGWLRVVVLRDCDPL